MRAPCVLAVAVLLSAAPVRAAPCADAPDPLPDAIPFRDLATRLDVRIVACASDARRGDANAFFARHALDSTDARMREYVVVRSLFELTRDGGPFRLRWDVTNRDPTAKHVWTALASSPPATTSAAASATAECDELSAVFAGLARRMGVTNVGLFWPTWNHTIAAWEPAPGVRVLVPTSQIFLGCDDTFDATSFDPTKQKTVFSFPANDVASAFPIPRALARFLLDQTTAYAGASLDVLGVLRTHRALRLGSSVPASCRAEIAPAALAVAARVPTAEDTRALVRYGTTELALPPTATAHDVLTALR